MNLYKEVFTHYSQKDSETGITKYFIAVDDEEAYSMVYEYSPCYVDSAIDDGDADENSKAKAIKEVVEARGEINMEIELYDLYYGVTHKGWELVTENITDSDTSHLIRLGVINSNE